MMMLMLEEGQSFQLMFVKKFMIFGGLIAK